MVNRCYLNDLLSWVREEHLFDAFLEWDGIVFRFLLPYQSVVETRAHNQILTIADTNKRQK